MEICAGQAAGAGGGDQSGRIPFLCRVMGLDRSPASFGKSGGDDDDTRQDQSL